MTNIDWDAVYAAADASPRGILSEFLDRADAITDLVIVARTVESDGGAGFRWRGSGESLMALGMVLQLRYELHQSQATSGRLE